MLSFTASSFVSTNAGAWSAGRVVVDTENGQLAGDRRTQVGTKRV